MTLMTAKVSRRADQSLVLGCTPTGKTAFRDRFARYPLFVSQAFYLEKNEPQPNEFQRSEKPRSERAYIYRGYSSPGVFAGDHLTAKYLLEPGSRLFLMDQSATKVHSMPVRNTLHVAESAGVAVALKRSQQATVCLDIEVCDQASLEYLQSPFILFQDSSFAQYTEVTLHPEASLALGEIMMPGRLAHGECYQFRRFQSQIRLKNISGKIWFTEALDMNGKASELVKTKAFATKPVLGTLVLVLPELSLTLHDWQHLEAMIAALQSEDISLASTSLPNNRGLLIRAMATATRHIQSSFSIVVNHARKLTGQTALPYSV